MARPQIFQGTWEELAVRAAELRKHRNLLLIVPAEKDNLQDSASTQALHQENSVSREDASSTEAERVARIYANMGKFAYSGLATKELHQERQADKEREERQILGYQP